ncbi:hypothetical protein [Promicromonospora sp. NPDC090134]|uniref:hypothetical protein n=1 Tax=Promicromonospora sp. NPDC090134 TaxID=3364408 RepID=UPI0037FB6B57
MRRQVAGDRARDRAHARGSPFKDHSGFVPTGQEGLVGDEQVDRDRDIASAAGFAAGDAFDQGVGHDLTRTPLVTGRLGGLGVSLQLGIRLHALVHGDQRRQVDHQVGCGPHGDSPLRDGLRVAVHARVHVQPGGEFLDPGDQAAGAHPGQLCQVRRAADLLIDQAAMLHGQVRRLADQERGPPRRQHPGLQGVEGVRHLRDPDSRGAQEPGTRVRAHPQRGTDLVGHTTTPPLRTDALHRFVGPRGIVQHHSEASLRRRDRVLQRLQLTEQVHPFGLNRWRASAPASTPAGTSDRIAVGGTRQGHARQHPTHLPYTGSIHHRGISDPGKDDRPGRHADPGQHRPSRRLIACRSWYHHCPRHAINL